MALIKNRQLRIWLLMVAAIIVWTIGTGSYRDLSASNEEAYKSLKLFSDVIELIEDNYVDEVKTKELIEKAIQGMVHGLDPHSSFLTPDIFKELKVDTRGKFTGIGIHITMRDGFIVVISPIEGTPAFRAGIKAGDIISKVDGKAVKDLREAVNMMRGPKGTKVVVTVVRKEETDPLDFTLVRDVIPIDSVKAVSLKPGYGYIRISNFRDSTTRDFIEALEKMEAGDTPLKGLVLDLRDNGGGLLDQSIKVSDLFLEKGMILSIKGRLKRNTKFFRATPDKVKRDYPIVVLINAGSASASEIVAGALQDHKRALILGTTSFGKGSVQTVETLRGGYGLKLTISKFYTPSGRSIQAKGIEPDIVVKRRFLSDEDVDKGERRQLKEKDLKNHLDAEPDIKKKKEKKEKESKKKRDKRRMEFNVGKLDLETLQSDNQVMRALEILVGYDIFKNLKG